MGSIRLEYGEVSAGNIDNDSIYFARVEDSPGDQPFYIAKSFLVTFFMGLRDRLALHETLWLSLEWNRIEIQSQIYFEDFTNP